MLLTLTIYWAFLEILDGERVKTNVVSAINTIINRVNKNIKLINQVNCDVTLNFLTDILDIFIMSKNGYN